MAHRVQVKAAGNMGCLFKFLLDVLYVMLAHVTWPRPVSVEWGLGLPGEGFASLHQELEGPRTPLGKREWALLQCAAGGGSGPGDGPGRNGDGYCWWGPGGAGQVARTVAVMATGGCWKW